MTRDIDPDAAIAAVIADVNAAQWKRLGELADELLENADTAGTWEQSVQEPNGVITLGWFTWSETLQEFVQLLYDAQLVSGIINWVNRIDDIGDITDASIATATQVDLVCMITAMVRSDRFNEGAIAGFVENGLLPKAVLAVAATAPS